MTRHRQLTSSLPDVQVEPAWEVALLFPGQGAWSEEDYLALDTNQLVELSSGTIEVLPMPTDQHQAIVGYLYTLLLTFARSVGGVVRPAPLRLRLWPGKFREPDLLLLTSASDPRRQADFWHGADLVVEVVSADNPARDTKKKRHEYAQAGIPEYWIVNPLTETVTVLQLVETQYVEYGSFRRGDTATSACFPELQADVAAVLDAP